MTQHDSARLSATQCDSAQLSSTQIDSARLSSKLYKESGLLGATLIMYLSFQFFRIWSHCSLDTWRKIILYIFCCLWNSIYVSVSISQCPKTFISNFKIFGLDDVWKTRKCNVSIRCSSCSFVTFSRNGW